jgi:4-hydroxy-4-methyl-2-oxoglutarate aldolase
MTEKISICQMADALGPTCRLERGITPIHAHFYACGPALTVACVPNDNLTLHHALHLAEPGQVLVVSGGGSCDTALWGELMSLAARMRGLRGTIIDGAVRDFWELKECAYPVFARGLTARKASKDKYGSINIDIRIGQTSVRPGDVVIADANGVLVIAADQFEEAVRLAGEVVAKEAHIKHEIARGRTIFDIFDLEKYVPKKGPMAH